MVCPICKKTFADSADSSARAFLPFCSDRCKLIDLGRWLDGKYQIPDIASAFEGDSAPSTSPRDHDEGEDD